MAFGDKFLVFGDSPGNFGLFPGQNWRRRGDSKTATYPLFELSEMRLLPLHSNEVQGVGITSTPLLNALNTITKDLISPHKSPMGTAQQLIHCRRGLGYNLCRIST